MQPTVEYRAATDDDIAGILALQSAVHRANVDEVTAAREGFVSWRHTSEILRRMNGPVPHTVALDGAGSVVGYALSMDPRYRTLMPEADAFVHTVGQLSWRGSPINGLRFLCMGQIAVARAFRGRGAFRGLYAAWFDAMTPHYDLGVTEIAVANARSMAAHAAVGWEEIGRHVDASGITWSVVAKDR